MQTTAERRLPSRAPPAGSDRTLPRSSSSADTRWSRSRAPRASTWSPARVSPRRSPGPRPSSTRPRGPRPTRQRRRSSSSLRQGTCSAPAPPPGRSGSSSCRSSASTSSRAATTRRRWRRSRRCSKGRSRSGSFARPSSTSSSTSWSGGWSRMASPICPRCERSSWPRASSPKPSPTPPRSPRSRTARITEIAGPRAERLAAAAAALFASRGDSIEIREGTPARRPGRHGVRGGRRAAQPGREARRPELPGVARGGLGIQRPSRRGAALRRVRARWRSRAARVSARFGGPGGVREPLLGRDGGPLELAQPSQRRRRRAAADHARAVEIETITVVTRLRGEVLESGIGGRGTRRPGPRARRRSGRWARLGIALGRALHARAHRRE